MDQLEIGDTVEWQEATPKDGGGFERVKRSGAVDEVSRRSVRVGDTWHQKDTVTKV